MTLEIKCRLGLPNAKVMTWHFDLSEAPFLTAAQLQSLADTVSTEWKTQTAIYATDMTLNAASAQRFVRVGAGSVADPFRRSPTTTLFIGSGINPIGTAIGLSVPPQVATVASFRTALPGKSFSGRAYLGPPPESQVDGAGLLLDGAARRQAVIDTVAAAEGAFAGSPALEHVVFSLIRNEFTPVITYVVNNRVDTQRKRLA